MASQKTEAEIKDKAKNLLVGKGIDENSADYLAELYSKSDRGKDHLNPSPITPAASCNTGIIPIF